MKGIQYDLATGVITGCVSPPIDVESHPEWPAHRGQIIVDGTVQYDGMKVDLATKTLVPATDGG